MLDKFLQFSPVLSKEQEEKIAGEFTRLQGHYYLEHAGATLYSEKQIRNISTQFCDNLYANPHARNLSSKITEDAIDVVRFMVLSHFNTTCEDYSLIFTSGATAALKLLGESFNYGQNGTLLYLQDNHTSVLGMREFAPRFECLKIDQSLEFSSQGDNNNSLFVYPAQSNFSGTQYPMSWIAKAADCNYHVALDAASFASTNHLDLSLYKPDFVAVSFYKMFGYPTGLGALIVKKSSGKSLRKRFFGGGTVLMAQAVQDVVVHREILHEKFEDGTVNFLSIMALKEGFATLKRLDLNFDLISRHTHNLAQYVSRNLVTLRHLNGSPVAILYRHDSAGQGGIVNFNLLRDNGDFVGYSEVLHFANLYGIHLRTGCFCNPGACQYFLRLSPEDVSAHFKAGHVCGDQKDLINNQPTGSIRISFGYMSSKMDAERLLEMVEKCYVSKTSVSICPLKSGKDKNNNTHNLIGGTLQQIHLYPIKSCGSFTVANKWPLTLTGLKYDRMWMIINADGVCVSQKHNRDLCLIVPVINLNKGTLDLTFRGRDKITIPLDPTSTSTSKAWLCQSKVCGDKIQGWDCGDPVSNWLVKNMKLSGLRLLRQCTEDNLCGRTPRNKNDTPQLSLSNKAQYLLVNSASVDWLRDKIPDLSEGRDCTIQRFRPNFVVDLPEAFMENDLKEMVIDGVKFECGGKCTRCQMICVDQTTGETSQEPLRTLAREFKGKIAFGLYLNNSRSYDGQSDQEEIGVGGKVVCVQKT